MPLAYIALGSNLGDRMWQMRRALELLELGDRVHVLRASPVYQNRAVGMGEDADDFLNAVVEVSSTLEPLTLLDTCLEVEEQLGRTRSEEGWAPRTIDLDILFYEGVSFENERLTLPHPRIAERDFVAVPLADLAPHLEINGSMASRIIEGLPQNEMKPYPESILC
ncbi:2-amino-4-hydroxy-6-hydroxymethyldihydropteridine diphosphokinase [Coraliomargarita sinensis]|uniref:2-amino-4-hydroxy-6-hydroxymethyldihydropteridine pyrophosphokinase n=1 Tax=Coraliomargarita sinensis TaxID=2174842 RepID=A0A317ZLI6_9BACT|nr:2-amino-4-hydroxy-6-hydroxymethyldihydropteridine diphosphokinase [Coraliomargarita sinensis]PXA04689.1 2-amino-4-hydroxy-6-hydroxymethyldihydropteridine diphosphokinase [Coraliomargarita sinensis]